MKNRTNPEHMSKFDKKMLLKNKNFTQLISLKLDAKQKQELEKVDV